MNNWREGWMFERRWPSVYKEHTAFCPTCRAMPYQWCRTSKGERATQPHPKRIELSVRVRMLLK